MREDQIDQAERRETLENDLKVLQQQGSTFHQHAQAQASELSGGRFAAIGSPRVIGATPSPASQYPAAAAHQSDPVGIEPPLGIDVNAMSESSMAPLVSVEVTGGAVDAPSAPPDVEHAAPPSFSERTNE
jgi:hypothetical protein